MEKKVLDLIIQEGKKLEYKRTWLKKSYNEIIKKLNDELKEIPDMSETQMSYKLRSWTEDNGNGYEISYKVRLALIFQNDAYVELQIGEYNEANGWEWEELYYPSMQSIRAFGSHLPYALSFFLDAIKKRNENYRDSIDIIDNILKKLNG